MEKLKSIRLSSWIIITSAAAVLSFFLWAEWAEIDQLTRAMGKVIPVDKVQVIQTADGGVVEEMRVREGDAVRKGQLLVRIDRVKVQAAGGPDAYREQQQKAQALKRLYREQPKARARQKAMARKRKRRFRDDGLPEAQRMATQVQNELRKAGMFGRCLASLKKAKRGKLWRYFPQLLKKRSFHVDIEGRRKAPPWEIAIVTAESR
jgi:adhesin transport system membrane fusion protein